MLRDDLMIARLILLADALRSENTRLNELIVKASALSMDHAQAIFQAQQDLALILAEVEERIRKEKAR